MWTLHEGDCLDIMRSLPDASVDAVITDPPYSSGTRREASKTMRVSMNRSVDDEDWFATDALTTNGFIWFMRHAAMEWKRLLVKGGHALVFIDWRMMPNMASAIETADLRLNGCLVWDKTYFGMGSCFRNQHEMILHFSNGKPSEPRRKDVGNVLRVPPIRGGEHPTEKPTDLLATLMSVVTDKGDTILDPFAGSGSLLEAAERTGRNSVGIELSAHFCDSIRRRMSAIQPTLL